MILALALLSLSVVAAGLALFVIQLVPTAQVTKFIAVYSIVLLAFVLIGQVVKLAIRWPRVRDSNRSWRESAEDLAEPATTFGLIVAAVTALLLTESAPTSDAKPNQVLWVSSSPLLVSVENPVPSSDMGTNRLLFTLPFPFEGSNCDADFGRGVQLYANSGPFFQDLAHALLRCGTAANPVQVEIIGYASSSVFKGCDDAEKCNRELALARAQTVHAGLSSENSDERMSDVAINEPQPWPNPLLMRAAYRASDKAADSYDRHRAFLTRRVDVEIVHSGTCEVHQPPPIA